MKRELKKIPILIFGIFWMLCISKTGAVVRFNIVRILARQQACSYVSGPLRARARLHFSRSYCSNNVSFSCYSVGGRRYLFWINSFQKLWWIKIILRTFRICIILFGFAGCTNSGLNNWLIIFSRYNDNENIMCCYNYSIK